MYLKRNLCGSIESPEQFESLRLLLVFFFFAIDSKLVRSQNHFVNRFRHILMPGHVFQCSAKIRYTDMFWPQSETLFQMDGIGALLWSRLIERLILEESLHRKVNIHKNHWVLGPSETMLTRKIWIGWFNFSNALVSNTLYVKMPPIFIFHIGNWFKAIILHNCIKLKFFGLDSL